MKLLLETIKIENTKVFNLSYHQNRFDKSRKDLFQDSLPRDLSSLIQAPKKGLFRCRILYNKTIQSIDYIPYTIKNIKTLKIIHSDIDYEYKYANREKFYTLLDLAQNYDDILIEKNGFITDTSIANIAFYDGKDWFTPKSPLLAGCMRQKLLDEGFLKTKNIKKEDIAHYSQVALINAMIGFNIIKYIKIT